MHQYLTRTLAKELYAMNSATAFSGEELSLGQGTHEKQKAVAA